jgi:hypothetical protein
MVNSAVRWLFVALPIVAVVAACGAEPAPPSDEPSTVTTTTSSPAPTTTTTTVAPFAAADGRNLDACADGTCEVFVQSGDVLANAVGSVMVTVENGTVAISDVSAGGMSSSLSGAPGSTQQINNQVFLIVAVQGAQGVLRLSLA